MTEQIIIEQLKPVDADATMSSNSDSKLPTQKAVKTYVDNRLKELGRFLSHWDCATGLPATDPEESPYPYKSGDHYIVSNVSTVNYRPSGSSYVTGVASTVVETSPVDIRNLYYYDGTSWLLLHGSQVEVAFANIGGSPNDNASLAEALNSKVPTSRTVNGKALSTDITLTSGDVLPNQTGQNGKYLTTDGTVASWGTINALQNIATGNRSLTILGTASTGTNCLNIGTSSGAYGTGSVRIGNNGFANQYSIAIGYAASAGDSGSSNSIAIGYNASAGSGQNSYCIAIGNECICRGFGSISLGSRGDTLREEGVFQVNLVKNNSGLYETHSFKLLDYTGKIPDDRITKQTTLSSSSTDNQVPSAKCVYDLVGNVEALINAL